MSLLTLILRNLKYYRKPYLAILAGTVISTAVLTGALVVGDSVRFSLEQLTDIRLGKTRFAIQSGDRLFRQELAGELATRTKSLVVPVLQLEGMAVNTDKNLQINRVEVLGVDKRFMELWNTVSPQPGEDEAFLSRNTAEKLNLKPGEEFLLKIHKLSKASENAPFVSEKEPLVVFRLKVAVIADDQQVGRFSLKSNQSPPFNIFISLANMNRKLKLTGNANLLLVAVNESTNLNFTKTDSILRLCWQPEDIGLEFRNAVGNKTCEIRSDRIFIADNIAKAIHKSIPKAEPILTYMVNAMSTPGKSTPYSFVTAANTGYLGHYLSDQEMLISDWLATDLGVKPGDSLRLRYFKMGPLRKLAEDSARFYIKSILPITDSLFDPALMPDFPGMSDAGSCRDWETGAPVNLDKIRDKDEQYWNKYRGTPKAFISLASGQKLWDNAFGHATAFRFPAESAGLQDFKRVLMTNLNPSENGLTVKDVYAEGKSAAAHSTDFGELFLSLSFFIIAAALLLTALLYSLHAQKRMSEIAVLATLGFRKKKIIRILLTEASLVVIPGSILGAISGIFYTRLLLLGLNTLWQDAVRSSMLQMHLVPLTIMLGFGTGVLTALLSLFFVIRRNLNKPLSGMVKGVDIQSLGVSRKREKISLLTASLSGGAAIVLIVSTFYSSRPDLSIPFLSAGGLILVSGMALLYFLLMHAGMKTRNSIPGFFGMILRNMNLKRRRTLTAIALLAIGTFAVIITGANRKTFYGTENTGHSGTGGFLFWAESTVPVLFDLNSPQGKEKYGLKDEPAFRDVKFLERISQNKMFACHFG